MNARPLSADGVGGLRVARRIRAERYHSLHPFHKLMYQGRLTRGQLQAWALNRYYYQARIPAKDATLIARLPTPELRRAWRKRLHDHDGAGPGEGGIARWLRLTDGLGLDRDYVVSTRGLLPITRFAVDAYVDIVPRPAPILEAIASCRPSCFRLPIIAERVGGMMRNYDFIDADTLGYLTPRLDQAPEDAEFALAYVKQHALTAEQQEAVLGRCCAPNATSSGPCWTHYTSLMSSHG